MPNYGGESSGPSDLGGGNYSGGGFGNSNYSGGGHININSPYSNGMLNKMTPKNNAMDDILKEIIKQMGLSQDAYAPYRQFGETSLNNMMGAGTASGLDQRLNDIMGTDLFNGLKEQRMRDMQGMLGAGGLTRSGAAMEAGADLPTDLAMEIENQLYGRNMAGVGIGAPFALNTGMNASQGVQGMINVQDIIHQLEAAKKSASASKSNSTMDLIGSVAGGLFSDPELKENVQQVGKFGELNVYQWDWKKEAKLDEYPTVGFMADEVEEKYPQHVHEYGGYKTIDYENLIGEING